MHALKVFWMGFWRLSLAFVLFLGFVYALMMVFNTFDIHGVAVILFAILFAFFSYGIGEVISQKREDEESRKRIRDHFDEMRRLEDEKRRIELEIDSKN